MRKDEIHPSRRCRPYDPLVSASTGARLRPVLVVLVVVALLGSGCSDDDDRGGGSGGGVTSSTGNGPSADERDRVLQLNVAVTGMNLVASDIGLRTVRGDAAQYCRSTARGELAPHRSALEAAADEEVRRLARAALDRLDRIIDLCGDGADPAAVQAGIQSYNGEFERLRLRVEALAGTGS